jgi:hypothetical protein
MTWTLCSIADPLTALAEIRRVLTREGQLIFIEHGRAVDPAVVRWQDRLTPMWKRFTGGCHLNRPIETQAEFGASGIGKGYVPGPRFGSYFYRGVTRPVIGAAQTVAANGGRDET